MRFLRGLWRVLIGVKDGLALILLLLVFVGLWGATRGNAPTVVPSGSALILDLNGTLVDQASERGFADLVSGGNDAVAQIRARDVVEAIHRATGDANIKSIVLDLDLFMGSGQANLQAVGEALRAFKAKGKPVYAYGTAYIDDGYYLAAQANEAWLDPMGGVLLSGPGGSNLYFKSALDKLGVDVEVFKVGTYKSAVEPYIRSDASPAAKAANQALVDTLWDSYTTDVEAARPKVKIDAILANLPDRVKAAGGDFAKAALNDDFVDRIGTRVAFGKEMVKRVGEGSDNRPGSFNSIKLKDYLQSSSPVRDRSGSAVGIVYVAGEIVDGKAPPGVAGGDTIADLISEATANDDIKALVVRIDSPGGSVTGSERIRQAIMDAKAEGLPIIASMGPVAASGGYWVSTAADEVFAEPSTITGSIGVFAIIPTFAKTLEKLGIGTDGVKATPYSGQPNVLEGLNPATKLLLQASVEDVYRRFTGLVAKSRHLTPARVDEIGQGRVWAGGTAHQLGLVDHLGGLDAAVAAAAKRASLDPIKARTIDIETKPDFLVQLLERSLGGDKGDGGGDAYARIARMSQMRAASQVADALSLSGGATMQARCLACVGHGTPQATKLPRLTEKGLIRELLH